MPRLADTVEQIAVAGGKEREVVEVDSNFLSLSTVEVDLEPSLRVAAFDPRGVAAHDAAEGVGLVGVGRAYLLRLCSGDPAMADGVGAGQPEDHIAVVVAAVLGHGAGAGAGDERVG